MRFDRTFMSLASAGCLCCSLGTPVQAASTIAQGALLYPGIGVDHYANGRLVKDQASRSLISGVSVSTLPDWTLTTIGETGAVQQVSSGLTRKSCMLRAQALLETAGCHEISDQGGSEICDDKPLAHAAACSE